MSRVWRAYHPGLLGEPGTTITLSPDESHHVRRVLRLAAGEPLRVFDGAGAEWSAVVEHASSREVVVRLVAPCEDGSVEPSLTVDLLQGWCRPERTDWIVQKATELGVASIGLLRVERAEGGRPSPARLLRWRRVAVEACKQSGRRRVPALDIVDDLPQVAADTLGLMPDPAPGHPPVSWLLSTERPRPLTLAIGPEGGFTADERALAAARGYVLASLGPRTLRCDTAAIAAVTIVVDRWGDLGSR